MQHVIWDWNGTLLDDLALMAEATSQSVQSIGGPPLSVDEYRRYHRRPLSLMYEQLVDRTISVDEWEQIHQYFHDTYAALLMERAELATDAIASLDRVASHRATQSVLSMWLREPLIALTGRLGISHYFHRIDALDAPGGSNKAEYLARHLRDLDHLPPVAKATSPDAQVVMIGDTADDGHAATIAGIRCVLVSTGAQHVDDLAATGWPVTGSLTEALDRALG